MAQQPGSVSLGRPGQDEPLGAGRHRRAVVEGRLAERDEGELGTDGRELRADGGGRGGEEGEDEKERADSGLRHRANAIRRSGAGQG